MDDKEYFIDLLLYHWELQCLVAIELKIGGFQRFTTIKISS
ncbi:MAG: DUF1016 domain-containing protein [Treponema sp.]|nr:DUF1016 domain-containing protein [Treponema sp.]